MIERAICFGFAFILLLVLAFEARSGERGAPQSTRDRYKAIVDRNIFLKDRSRPTPTFAPVAAQPMYRPERDIILTGIARQGEELVAFLEDIHTRTTSRVRPEDTVAQGRIVRIEIDHILFEKENQVVKVELGKSLAGGPAVQLNGSPSAEAPQASPATAPPPLTATSTAESAILERLRQRRQKELNKQ